MTYVEHIRLLCCEFEIRTNSRDVINRLSFVTQRAEQDLPVVDRSTVIITWSGEEFHIRGDGMEDDFELSITSGLETLYQRLCGRAIAALPDHIRINAATGMCAAGSFLIMGPQRAGKTTLALSLMLEGIDVTGDGMVLLLGRNALAFPRKFYAREDSIRHLPRLRGNGRFATCFSNPQESRLVALDPLEFGKPWKIAPAVVSTVLYIEPNHGSRSELRRSGKVEMMRRALPYCAPPLSGRQGWLGDLCATVDRADTFIIEFGDVDSALRATLRVLGHRLD